MALSDYKDYILQNIELLGYKPSENHFMLINMLYEELVEWNKHTNLTRITGEKDYIDKHILDSLSCIKGLTKKETDNEIKVIDIGTGAGFPILPLWFFFPRWKITLVDSVRKKLDFIDHFSKKAIDSFPELKNENIEIIHSRSEDIAKDKKYREKFDLVVSRAVANLSSLSELCFPFIKIGGRFIAMKSIDSEKELDEAKKVLNILGAKKTEFLKFELLSTGFGRSLIIIEKGFKTPSDYPRKAGIPQKDPII